jgi:acyl-CoA thioesterase I
MRSEIKTLRMMSARRAFYVAVLLPIALLLALGAAACSDGKKLARLPAGAVVLAFGDSLTFGTGATESESYPAQLERLIGRRVVRAGIPGETTAQALARARLPDALEEHAPRMLLLCIGGNDFLQRLGHPQAAANVREMVKIARGRGIEVLLIATPEPGLRVVPPAFYSDIAREHGLLFEDAVIGEVLTSAGFKSDTVHPNARGYRVIAERLAERLRKSGAI